MLISNNANHANSKHTEILLNSKIDLNVNLNIGSYEELVLKSILWAHPMTPIAAPSPVAINETNVWVLFSMSPYIHESKFKHRRQGQPYILLAH